MKNEVIWFVGCQLSVAKKSDQNVINNAGCADTKLPKPAQTRNPEPALRNGLAPYKPLRNGLGGIFFLLRGGAMAGQNLAR